ncbi:MAG: DMT family transporter [Ideonella sp.]
MKGRDLLELIGLAALWGASFMFMRVGAAQFGAVALAALRVAGAAAVLIPLVFYRREIPAMRANWKPILLLGITNSAIPFLAFAYALLTISGGLSSIFNAASPLFAATIAWLWLNDRLNAARTVGLLIGFAGVIGLIISKSGVGGSAGAGDRSTLLAVLACIVAAAAYGFSANFTKRYLAGVPTMAVAGGSQLAATLVLALPAALFWPDVRPGIAAWVELATLSVFCTGLAYVIFFRLIANVGPANAITVTFLIPAFAVGWGALFLGEQVSSEMLIGCAVILFGTALAIGVWKPARFAR